MRKLRKRRRCIRCGKYFLLEKHKSRIGCPKCIKEVHEEYPWHMSKDKKQNQSRFELLDL